MAAKDNHWEDILKRRLDDKPGPGTGRRVRLSELSPPTGLKGSGRTGDASFRRAPPPPPPPPTPQRPPAPPPPRQAEGGTVPQLRAMLGKSELARQSAESRVAELERELAELKSGVSRAGDANGEIEQLRRRLEEAHAIIRAIEEAYLAGNGGRPVK